MLHIRSVTENDTQALYQLSTTFFPGQKEARLLDILNPPFLTPIALVALWENKIVGHILFTRTSLKSGRQSFPGLSLTYLCVHPAYRNQGIGKALVEAGLAECQNLGYHCISTFGMLPYFAEFEFDLASTYRISCPNLHISRKLLIHWTDTSYLVEGALLYFPTQFFRFYQTMVKLANALNLSEAYQDTPER